VFGMDRRLVWSKFVAGCFYVANVTLSLSFGDRLTLLQAMWL
jgi:hypothetical protein